MYDSRDYTARYTPRDRRREQMDAWNPENAAAAGHHVVVVSNTHLLGVFIVVAIGIGATYAIIKGSPPSGGVGGADRDRAA